MNRTIDPARPPGVGELLSGLARRPTTGPGSIAVVSHRSGAGRKAVTWLTFRSTVERYAAALRRLGVGPGEVVAIQLPNWWRTSALIMACWRIGAVAAVLPEGGVPWGRLDPAIAFTVNAWKGARPGAGLAELAPSLPSLRHRVVLVGDRSTSAVPVPGEGVLDFAAEFERAARRDGGPVPGENPDQPAVVLLAADRTPVTRSFGDLGAVLCSLTDEHRMGADDVVFCVYDLSGLAGLVFGLLLPAVTGSTAVLLDTFTPEEAGAITAEQGVTILAGDPAEVGKIEAPAQRPRTIELGRGYDSTPPA